MGAHSSKDPEGPLAVGSHWWQRQYPPDEAPTAVYRTPVGPPVGLPPELDEDPYRDAPARGRAPVGFDPRPVSPPIRTEGMPTQDAPRQPRPVSSPPIRPTPAERPSLVIRAMDAVGGAVAGAGFALAVVIFAAVATAWAYGMDREVDRLNRENRDLRQVQISQQQRLNDARDDVEQARSESTEAKEDTDNLQRRVTQLEEQDQPQSGS